MLVVACGCSGCLWALVGARGRSWVLAPWWCVGGWCGSFRAGAVAYMQPTPGGHATRLPSAAEVSLLNQGFGVKFRNTIALIINYLDTPFGRAFT